MPIAVHVVHGQETKWTETGLRDVVSEDGAKATTVFQIKQWNYDRWLGFAHLTEAERQARRHDILDGLADARRTPFAIGGRRFTKVHGDYRLYYQSGGQSDTCYGTAYDPRLFHELAAEGLIKFSKTPHGFDTWCAITDAGMAALEAK